MFHLLGRQLLSCFQEEPLEKDCKCNYNMIWFIQIKCIRFLHNIIYNDNITLSMFHLQWPKVVSKQWMERDRGRILWVPITLPTTPILLFLQLFQLRSLQQQKLKVSSEVKVAHSVLRVKIILKARKRPNCLFIFVFTLLIFLGTAWLRNSMMGSPFPKEYSDWSSFFSPL